MMQNMKPLYLTPEDLGYLHDLLDDLYAEIFKFPKEILKTFDESIRKAIKEIEQEDPNKLKLKVKGEYKLNLYKPGKGRKESCNIYIYKSNITSMCLVINHCGYPIEYKLADLNITDADAQLTTLGFANDKISDGNGNETTNLINQIKSKCAHTYKGYYWHELTENYWQAIIENYLYMRGYEASNRFADLEATIKHFIETIDQFNKEKDTKADPQLKNFITLVKLRDAFCYLTSFLDLDYSLFGKKNT